MVTLSSTWHKDLFYHEITCVVFINFLPQGEKDRDPGFTFSHVCACVLNCCSCVNSATVWTVTCQAPLSVGFSRQEYWRELPCLTSPHFAISPVLGLADNPFLVDSSGSSHGNDVPSLLHQSLHCFPQISAQRQTPHCSGGV